MAWGVTPTTFVGHSLGEYVAAHLAGVLTLDGALDLVVARSRLMERASGAGAAMLAVPLPEAEVAAAAAAVAVAGHDQRRRRVRRRRAGRRRRRAAGAAHRRRGHADADPARRRGAQLAARPDPARVPRGRRGRSSCRRRRCPYLSNLTGTWITAEQATDPQYWVDHLRHTVRFADCLRRCSPTARWC